MAREAKLHLDLRFRPSMEALVALSRGRQGLMMAAGNPKGIAGIADLKRVDIRFVNRQVGSGTRLEIDQMLERERIAPGAVSGYDLIETTHLAVAAAVASGEADADIGIEAAAAQFGLPGYDTAGAGEVVSPRQAMPWYPFRKPKL